MGAATATVVIVLGGVALACVCAYALRAVWNAAPRPASRAYRVVPGYSVEEGAVNCAEVSSVRIGDDVLASFTLGCLDDGDGDGDGDGDDDGNGDDGDALPTEKINID